MTPRVDASYTSQVYSDVFNNNYLRIGAHTVANLRVTWRSVEDQWQIALEGTNLTNNYYYVTVFDLSGLSAFVDAQPSRPREWAMTVKRTFK